MFVKFTKSMNFFEQMLEEIFVFSKQSFEIWRLIKDMDVMATKYKIIAQYL